MSIVRHDEIILGVALEELGRRLFPTTWRGDELYLNDAFFNEDPEVQIRAFDPDNRPAIDRGSEALHELRQLIVDQKVPGRILYDDGRSTVVDPDWWLLEKFALLPSRHEVHWPRGPSWWFDSVGRVFLDRRSFERALSKVVRVRREETLRQRLEEYRAKPFRPLKKQLHALAEEAGVPMREAERIENEVLGHLRRRTGRPRKS